MGPCLHTCAHVMPVLFMACVHKQGPQPLTPSCVHTGLRIPRVHVWGHIACHPSHGPCLCAQTAFKRGVSVSVGGHVSYTHRRQMCTNYRVCEGG